MTIVILGVISDRGLAEAASKSKSKKGPRGPSMDREYGLLRESCTEKLKQDSPSCFENDATRENCVLECVSPTCYDQIYGKDPVSPPPSWLVLT